MTPLRRSLSAVAATTVIALAVTGCGGEEKKPAAASKDSKKEFCAAVDKALASATSPTSFTEDGWKEIQAAFAKVGDVGVPEDATAEQRKGVDVIVKAITSTDFATVQKAQAAGSLPGVSKADEALAQAFVTGYYQPQCATTSSPSAPASE